MLQEMLTEKEEEETRLSERLLRKWLSAWLPTWLLAWISSWLPWLQTWFPNMPRGKKYLCSLFNLLTFIVFIFQLQREKPLRKHNIS